ELCVNDTELQKTPLPFPSLMVSPDRERLDRYLVRTGLAPSRHAARELVERGMVRINGRKSKKSEIVSRGDSVEVTAPRVATSIQPNSEIHIDVLHEDASALVVNKPGSVPCHPIRPGERGTVMNAIAARFPDAANAGDKPLEGGLVHRLDNGTSGA